jgi:hypothetical protein
MQLGGANETAYRILVVKSFRNRPFGRLSRRWEDNININFREMGLQCGSDVIASKSNSVVSVLAYDIAVKHIDNRCKMCLFFTPLIL